MVTQPGVSHTTGDLGSDLESCPCHPSVPQVVSETPPAFVALLSAEVGVDGKTLRFCYERLTSLLKTLEIANTGVRV